MRYLTAIFTELDATPPTVITTAAVPAATPAGIRTPVIVPLSADGDQHTALRQVFAAFE